MTIPSRPAPAPPALVQSQNAAAGANASIEQLRLQLEEQHRQHQQQQQQTLTIKLPPPPKVPVASTGLQAKNATNNNYNNNNNYYDTIDINNTTSSSITRKFPKARYAPATNWDDAPFELTPSSATAMNGNLKKMPPPRPPPPKLQAINGRRNNTSTSSSHSNGGNASNMLTNLFQRKKNQSKTMMSSTTNGSSATASRHYYSTSNSSSVIGNSNSNNTGGGGGANSYFTHTNQSMNWNTNWSSSTTTTTTLSNIQQQSTQEAQLISFDSPPSSPTFTQKSNSDCVSVDSFSSDSNFSSPHNGSVSQPESGFEDDFNSRARSRPATTSPLDPWESMDAFGTAAEGNYYGGNSSTTTGGTTTSIGTAPVRNLNAINTRLLASNDNPLCNGKSLLPPPTSLTAPTIIKPKISQKPKAPKPPMLTKQPPQNFALFDNSDLLTPPSPPMPQCAPPPPPPSSATAMASSSAPAVSILDVISGKVDAMHLAGAGGGAYNHDEHIQPYGIALYDFEGVELDDLSFRENDKIYLLEQVSEEWYRGRTRAGCEGIFPANYIDVKEPLPTNHYHAATNGIDGSAAADYKPVYARCLYNFPAEVDGDLALKENDFVCVLSRINEDWLYGECNGKHGQFPANFLEEVPKNLPLP